MRLGAAKTIGGASLAVVVAVSVAVFAVASVVGAVGYPEWMWWFVFAGLVLPPVVVVVAVAAAVIGHISRA